MDKHINFRSDETTLNYIKDVAEGRGVSLSEAIREIVKEHKLQVVTKE